jgi:hypothetical protein
LEQPRCGDQLLAETETEDLICYHELAVDFPVHR